MRIWDMLEHMDQDGVFLYDFYIHDSYQGKLNKLNDDLKVWLNDNKPMVKVKAFRIPKNDVEKIFSEIGESCLSPSAKAAIIKALEGK